MPDDTGGRRSKSVEYRFPKRKPKPQSPREPVCKEEPQGTKRQGGQGTEDNGTGNRVIRDGEPGNLAPSTIDKVSNRPLEGPLACFVVVGKGLGA